MVESKHLEMIICNGVGRSGLANENEVITSALRELLRYRDVGTVEGFETAIRSSLEYYNLMKEYKQQTEDVRKIIPKFSHNLSDVTSY